MTIEALIDTDILYKMARYGLTLNLIQSAPFGATHFSMLNAARFMIRRKLQQKPPARGAELAIEEFHAAINALHALEPTNEEIRLAAELELTAQAANLELDGGESQLCAVLILRAKHLIFTGDKRAIRSVAALIRKEQWSALREKFICLEQAFLHLLEVTNAQTIRKLICDETSGNSDKSIRICFSCTAKEMNIDSCLQALMSYVVELNSQAPNVLLPAGKLKTNLSG